MQILEVVIYSYDKTLKPESIPLHLNDVNLIVGPSNSGKSGIGKIIEYCLGREKFIIPSPGPMDNRILWYGVKGQINNEQFFVARENPYAIDPTPYRTYMKIGSTVEVPKIIERPNTRIDLVAQTLSRKMGMIPGLKLPWPNYLYPVQASLKECAIFCFQYQDEAQSSTSLLHRGDSDYWPQIIKHIFPYFLGAIPDDKAIMRFDLLQIEREINSLSKRAEELQVIIGVGFRNARKILAEAKSVGIINDNDVEPKTFEDYVLVIEKISEWRPDEIPSNGESNLEELQEKAMVLRSQLTEINRKINIVANYRDDFVNYKNVIERQKFRLKPIGLDTKLNGEFKKCPLCSNDLEEELPISIALEKSLKELEEKLTDIDSEVPSFDSVLDELVSKKEDVLQQIDDNFEDIKGILNQHDEIKQKYDDNMRRARVAAKASFWLDNVNRSKNEEIQEEIEEKSYLRDKIHQELNFNLITNKTIEILYEINKTINDWAKQLKLEFSDYYVELNLDSLGFQIQEGSRTKKVTNMSGENWLGYHLVTTMALHSYFNEHKRPVPNFLFFDQPSQVYSPTSDKDEDHKRIEYLYDFIFKLQKQKPFQMILVDHANYENTNPEFARHIRKKFTLENRFVPNTWPTIDQV